MAFARKACSKNAELWTPGGGVGDRRRDLTKDGEKVLRISLDRPDRVVGEDLRPDPLEDAPVLDDV
jgi:hypothetical protein